MFNIVLLGPPGSGKGTQSTFLSNEYGLVHLSTGDIIRDNIKNNTSLGLVLKEKMDKNQFVDDNIIANVIADKLYDIKQNFILDGFPRNLNQAKIFMEWGPKLGIRPTHVIELTVDQNKLVDRIVERANKAIELGQEPRKDDNPTALKQRLIDYNTKTKPVSDYFKQFSLLHEINGMDSPSDVFSNIQNCLGDYFY
jgi:adenylate kinase